jgi:hypothetical protein
LRYALCGRDGGAGASQLPFSLIDPSEDRPMSSDAKPGDGDSLTSIQIKVMATASKQTTIRSAVDTRHADAACATRGLAKAQCGA